MGDTDPAGKSGEEVGSKPSEEGGQFTAITSQDELNKVLNERLARERGKFADYKDVKAKAARFDELEQANKSEIDKANDRIAQAEQRAAAAESSALRARIQAGHGISDEDAELFLTGTDEETLTKQAKRLEDRAVDRKKQGNRVPKEGTSPKSPESDERAFVRGLFGTGG